jgi:hypothetical protein
MALVGNRSVLHKSPGRFLAGTIASGNRNNFSQAGMIENAYEVWSDLSAIPNGHNVSAWILPKKRGAMSSRNVAGLTIDGTGAGALGVNIDGVAGMTFSAEAIGQLIASGTGSASFSFDATGNLVATIGGTGSASFVIVASGTAGAIGWANGVATMEVTATAVRFAIGHMTGTTVDDTVLTADQIAAAVWAYMQ